MDAKWHVLLSGTLTFGVPLLLAWRELVLLRRPSGGAWPGEGPKLPESLPPRPESPRALPECLQIKPAPAKATARVPELV